MERGEIKLLLLLYFRAPEAKKGRRSGDHGGLRGWTPIEEGEERAFFSCLEREKGRERGIRYCLLHDEAL